MNVYKVIVKDKYNTGLTLAGSAPAGPLGSNVCNGGKISVS